MESTGIEYGGSSIKIESFEKTIDNNFRIIGRVYNDDRFSNGTLIHTSTVEFIDFVEGYFKTENTIYHMAKEPTTVLRWLFDLPIDGGETIGA